jgi:hypothetical protein
MRGGRAGDIAKQNLRVRFVRAGQEWIGSRDGQTRAEEFLQRKRRNFCEAHPSQSSWAFCCLLDRRAADVIEGSGKSLGACGALNLIGPNFVSHTRVQLPSRRVRGVFGARQGR